MDTKQIVQFITTCKREELDSISRACSIRWKILQLEATAQLMVSDRVEFTAKGEKHTGTVTAVGNKNVKVRTDNGQRWTVSASLITKL